MGSAIVGENTTADNIVNADLTKDQFDQEKQAFIKKLKNSVTPPYKEDSYYIK